MNRKRLSTVELIQRVKSSAFAKTGETHNIAFENIIKQMEAYTNSQQFIKYMDNPKLPFSSSEDFLKHCVPGFQRDNDKWTKKMQIKFIENLLSGLKIDIKLFKLRDSDEEAKLMDGLQRTTAILKFLDNRLKIFEGYDFKELGSVEGFNSYITLTVYEFDTWEEVGNFYISMNENISHSKNDIKKAKDWFLENHGIKL